MAGTKNDSKNILVGAAAFYITDEADAVASTLSALAVAGSANKRAEEVINTTGTWTTPGYTDGGVEVSYEPTYGDVTVDQLLDSAVTFKSGMKVTVNTTFSEATLENLVVVWGQNTSSKSGDVLDIEGGQLGDFPTERALAFVGPGPRTASGLVQRVYLIERAIQTSTTAHSLKRDAATTLPVSFRCLPTDANKYGKVRDRAVAA